ERRLTANKDNLAICYVDLNQFKAFNDHYGFKRGDDVIKKTTEILMSVSQVTGSSQDFIGHIGGDDFILLTTPERAEPICQTIIDRFDAIVPSLYDETDRKKGYIPHIDRQGRKVKIPLLSISIALVTNEAQPLTHPGEIARIGAELKSYAKQFNRSIYVKERRTIPP
ncbi:MAG: diguanylate cyclase, partial [Nitrososphaera sp.]|nr:diguanylate cyclase [Nitrososphaera sp.]